MANNQISSTAEERRSTGGSDISRRSLFQAAAGVGLAATAGCVGQLSTPNSPEWPARQIEIISPWGAGGGADRTSRAVARAAEQHTDVSWIVTNKTGGSGAVGMSAVVNADASGYTVGFTAPEICLYEHLNMVELGPDDITPIMQYTQLPAALVVSENAKYTSLDDFLAYADSNSEPVQMGTSGIGSSWQMAGAAFADEAGISVDYVPYDGASSAITATAGGEVDCATVGAPEVASQVRDGSLTALGVMHDEQVEALPETPTMQSQGVDVTIGSWGAHFAPPGLPDDVLDSMVEVYNTIYEDEKFKQFMKNNNFIRLKRGPDELQQFLNERYEYYGKLVEKIGISL